MVCGDVRQVWPDGKTSTQARIPGAKRSLGPKMPWACVCAYRFWAVSKGHFKGTRMESQRFRGVPY